MNASGACRFGIGLNAGATTGIMATDALESNGMKLATLQPETVEFLRQGLPAAANVYNPVDVIGDALADRYEHALQGVLTHNFNNYLSATVSSEVYDGFLYNYEDNEFVVVDGKGVRTWFLLRSRVSDRLSWRLKWTTDRSAARTYVDIRDYGNLLSPTPDAVNAGGGRSSFRFQLDCSL